VGGTVIGIVRGGTVIGTFVGGTDPGTLVEDGKLETVESVNAKVDGVDPVYISTGDEVIGIVAGGLLSDIEAILVAVGIATPKLDSVLSCTLVFCNPNKALNDFNGLLRFLKLFILMPHQTINTIIKHATIYLVLIELSFNFNNKKNILTTKL
jgi:hypothetical protein